MLTDCWQCCNCLIHVGASFLIFFLKAKIISNCPLKLGGKTAMDGVCSWAEAGQVLCAQAWKPGSQHAGEKRGVADLLLGRTERAARAAELQLCAQAR